MAVPTERRTVAYVYKAAVAKYAIPFSFLANSEIVVTLDDDVLVEDTDYEIDDTTVVFLEEFDDDLRLTIERTVPYTQPTDYSSLTVYEPAQHMASLDESTFQRQQLDARLRAIETDPPEGLMAGDGIFTIGDTVHVGNGTGILTTENQVWLRWGEDDDVQNINTTPARAGDSDFVARANHKHDIDVGTPVAVTPGATADEGTATSLVKSDHVHAVAGGSPVDVSADGVNDEGDADTFARSDHKHSVGTDEAVSLTDDTNFAGVATTLSLSDHTHAHGDRGGGSLHDLAVASGAAGFMSGADKAKLDTYPDAFRVTVTTVTNHHVVDDTETAILDLEMLEEVQETIEYLVTMYYPGGTQGASFAGYLNARNNGGTVTWGHSPTFVERDDAAHSINFLDTDDTLQLAVTGPNDDSYWSGRFKRFIRGL